MEPTIDFASGISKAERQRKMAELLRAQAMKSGPEGQMVSGHYVAPSWSQQLQPLANAAAAWYQDKKATEAEGASNQAIQQARKQWQSSLPQAIAARAEQAGPVDPNNPTELMGAPAQPVTAAQILKHTLAGMEIPGNEKVAGLYNQTAMADLSREDAQTFRKEEAAAARAQRMVEQQNTLAARAEELKMRLEDRSLDRASREAMAKEQRALTAQIASGNLELRRLAIEAKSAADASKAEEKRNAAAEKAKVTTQDEKSSAGYLNRMNEAEKLLTTIGSKGDVSLVDKAIGGIPMIGKTVQPYVLNKDQEKLLQAQRDWVRAKLRKESGAVIGDEEMAEEIRTYFPQPGESPEVAKQKAVSRQAAARQLEIGAGRELPNANMGTRAPGAAQNPPAPQPGTAQGGYVYVGGDPSLPTSWRKQ